MKLCQVTPLVFTIWMLSFKAAWGCLGDASLPNEEDLKYPPVNMIAFKGTIERINGLGNLSQKPHNGFRLNLKIKKIYKGTNLKSTIAINYGNCHNLPGKQGELINVLALPSPKGGWYVPQFWRISK